MPGTMVMPLIEFVSYVMAGLIGAFVSAAELIGRYRNVHWHVFRVSAAWVHLVLNVAAAMAGVALVRQFAPDMMLVNATVLGALGAILLLRSSFFTLRIEATDLPVGPASILTTLLAVV